MTQFDVLLTLVSGLIAILSFIGALGVNALIKMSKDLNEIKTMVMVLSIYNLLTSNPQKVLVL